MTCQLTGIFGLATSPQRSALHIIRITGDDLKPLSRLFGGKNLFSGNSQPKTQYSRIHDLNGQILDDVVVTGFSQPWSYTGLDVLEITCHGNPLISRQIFKTLRELGLREAKPGEFTFLAVLNNKLSLIQAERIQALIQAPNIKSLELFSERSQKKLQEHFQRLKDHLMYLLSHLESVIEFQEDVGDDPLKDLDPIWESLIQELETLKRQFEWSKSTHTGIHVGLFGRPNVGKSSLFNYILKRDEAIVTEIPGTTRDILSAQVDLDGQTWTFYDTAGLHETHDPVEQLGIEKAQSLSQKVDIRIFLTDSWLLSMENFEHDLREFQNTLSNIDIILLTKSDLNHQPDMISQIQAKYPEYPIWPISVEDDPLISNILESLRTKVLLSLSSHQPEYGFTERQGDLITKTLEIVKQEYENRAYTYPEILSHELRRAYRQLEELLGVFNPDDMYARIFSKFCIGK